MVNKVNKVNVSGCVRLKYIYVSIMYPDLSTWSSDVCGCICRMYKFFILKSNISLWIFFLIKQERRSCIIRKKQLFLSQEIVSQCTRENNLYFYPLRQFYNTHTVFVNNKYVKTVTVTGCINFSFKKAIFVNFFLIKQERRSCIIHARPLQRQFGLALPKASHLSFCSSYHGKIQITTEHFRPKNGKRKVKV